MLGSYAMESQLRRISFVIWLFLVMGLRSGYTAAMFISLLYKPPIAPLVYFLSSRNLLYFEHCENFNPLSTFLSSTPTGVAKRGTSAYDIAAFDRKQQDQPEPGSGFKLLRLPRQSQASAPGETHPTPTTHPPSTR